MDVPKSFALQPTQRSPQLLTLPPNDVRTEIALGPPAITRVTELLVEIEGLADLAALPNEP